VPVGGRIGRLDIQLRSEQETVSIESKVESPLRENQLTNYQSQGIRNLVIVTKYPPEISARTLRRRGVRTVRWQDVHERLHANTPRNSRERFICHSFAKYLEESEMAYPTKITLRDLNYMAESLRAVRSNIEAGRVLRSGFDTAARCLNMLGLLAKDLRDAYRPFEHAAQWGPGYFNVVDGGRVWHALSVTLYRKPWNHHMRFACSIYVPQDRRDMRWGIEYNKGSSERLQIVEPKLRSFVSQTGVLAPAKLLDFAALHARKWRVRL
jgi:hypothetical protein